MTIKIECVNTKNEKFMAHEVHAEKKIIKYKCGSCMVGDIFFDRKKKLIFNLKNNRCSVCAAIIKIK